MPISIRAQIITEVKDRLSVLGNVVLSKEEVLAADNLPVIALELPSDDVSEPTDDTRERVLTVAVSVFHSALLDREDLLQQVEISLSTELPVGVLLTLINVDSASDASGGKVLYGATLNFTTTYQHLAGNPAVIV